MIANYHTHTPRCKHAQGSETEYVQCAIRAGLEILGFADHTPYPFPAGYISSFRMGVEEIDSYANAVRTAQKQFAEQIQVHLGVEAEYYPKYFADMVSLLRDHGVEYMILGQHMIGNEIDEPYLGIPDGNVKKLELYCDQAIEAMHTGLFTYFAHPDLFHFVGERKDYQTQMRRLCQAAKSCGVPLEINLLGMQGHRHYPNPFLWEIVGEEDCQVILGRDAHQPEALLETATEAQALEMVRQYGLNLITTVPLRPIG